MNNILLISVIVGGIYLLTREKEPVCPGVPEYDAPGDMKWVCNIKTREWELVNV